MTTTERRVRPYGSWPSPFPPSLLTSGVVFLSEPHAADGIRWWLEGRPDEAGRQVLVRRERDGAIIRLTPEGFNVRSRVHEYGGGAVLIDRDLVVVSDFATGRLQRVVGPGELTPLTPEGDWRYADLILDAARDRLIAVREDHTAETVAAHGEWVNELVAISLADGSVSRLVGGADFYAAPRLSPDGTRLAWLEWSHPNMPWDGTHLQVGTLGVDGHIVDPTRVAGSQSDWISQPRWAPDGALHFVAEPDGWMNIYRGAQPVTALRAEFAGPDWVFGLSSYGFQADGTILAIARDRGRDRLHRIHSDGRVEPIELPYTEMASLAVDGDRLVFRAASPTEPTALVELDLGSGEVTVLRHATEHRFEPERISVAEQIEFPTTGGTTAFGLFYRPTSPDVVAPEGERPPLIVTSHGGPTAQAYGAFATGIQLFTSRGIAVLDVDYGGSSGYGREYRKRLEGEWGVVDVDDCVNGARYLAEQGLVDAGRIAVRGGSASGFTTLAALAFRDAFRAGISYFGIGDLRAFVGDTHKFESRYLERLVGPYPATEATYIERSPALHADRITAPVLVLQGAEDRVVPPAEAERIVDALFERGVPHAYLLFPGEDHGFRSSGAIIRSFQAELTFLGAVFRFEPADELPPLEIVRPPKPATEPGSASRSAAGRPAASD